MSTRKLILTTLLALTLGSAFPSARAQADSIPRFEPLMAQGAAGVGQPGLRGQRAMRIASDPALAAIMQMRMIERIYLRENHKDQAEHMYREVLERTQNTLVRNFVNMRLTRLAAWQPRNLDAALVELKRGLDENLAKVR